MDQSASHHDGRIDKRRSTTHDQYTNPVFFALGISEVFIITTIPKKHPKEVKARSD
jgi:hypothetical protein